MTDEAIRLCALSEIDDPGSHEFSWGEGDWPLSVFVVRRGDAIRAYINRCPHAGHELNLRPNEFLTREGDLIMCRSHGAQFRIDDGLCVFGPCPGTSLEALEITVVDGIVCAQLQTLDGLAAAAQTRR